MAGRGRGYRNRFYATGVPFREYSAEQTETLPPQEELDLLRSEAERLRSVLEGIEKRLAELEIT